MAINEKRYISNRLYTIWLAKFIDYIKVLPHFFLPQLTLTNLAGILANVRLPIIKNILIRLFIQRYDVNMGEAIEENFTKYNCFNDFFIRHLKPHCRVLADCDIVAPVDGYLSELGHINSGKILQVKGHFYNIDELLACELSLSRQFVNGCFATFYLSPKDYHRVHLPIAATLNSMIYVPGKLFSVQPITVRVIPFLFARNERLVMFFTTRVGLMAIIFVGATMVGTIGTRWHGDLKRSPQKRYFSVADFDNLAVGQGEELGYFKLGSTVILLFANNKMVHWLPTLSSGQSICYGQALANIPS